MPRRAASATCTWRSAAIRRSIEQVRAGFDQALQTAQSIPLPLAEAVEDAAARDQVQRLVDQIKQLRELIRGPVAATLGLSIGFNATDGD